MLTDFLEKVYSAVNHLSSDLILAIAWCAFAAIYVSALALSLFNSSFRRADKRPVMWLVNAFTAITLAALLMEKELSFGALISALFWCVGYMLYGVLNAVSRAKKRAKPAAAAPVQSSPPPISLFRSDVRPAKVNVRTEHALSITEKLLSKDLGKGDRQEVERIKSALEVLQLKGDMTPEENERLNDNFNTLLKFMAKYGV